LSAFLYFSGLLIGIAAFIYMLSIYEKAKVKISRPAQDFPPEPENLKMETGNIAFNKRPSLPPGTRICPLCGSSLTKYEGLYASKTFRGESASLIIMGCKYCYKEPGNSPIPE
jgi:hypothetical protein